ncbi:MAG: Uma2 family endonuclease, partial [Leptolyngbya sp. SIO4C5]|nr:Uma2 family endonuclease [Leptolyngbya sp. SIO4C5]
MVLADQTRVVQTEAGPIVLPPDDLSSNEPPLETYLHLQQMMLLLKCLDWLWRDRNDYFAAGNLTIYYNARRLKTQDFRGPDFFVVSNTEKRPRKSWIVWEEGGRYPNLIVELLSDTTAESDRQLKKEIYQNIFRTPEYFWFSPDTLEFQGYVLERGIYHPITSNNQGHLWSEQLQLFLGIHERQLRFFSAEGQLVPTPEEDAAASMALATA